jgi:hypothetical protein
MTEPGRVKSSYTPISARDKQPKIVKLRVYQFHALPNKDENFYYRLRTMDKYNRITSYTHAKLLPARLAIPEEELAKIQQYLETTNRYAVLIDETKGIKFEEKFHSELQGLDRLNRTIDYCLNDDMTREKIYERADELRESIKRMSENDGGRPSKYVKDPNEGSSRFEPLEIDESPRRRTFQVPSDDDDEEPAREVEAIRRPTDVLRIEAPPPKRKQRAADPGPSASPPAWLRAAASDPAPFRRVLEPTAAGPLMIEASPRRATVWDIPISPAKSAAPVTTRAVDAARQIFEADPSRSTFVFANNSSTPMTRAPPAFVPPAHVDVDTSRYVPMTGEGATAAIGMDDYNRKLRGTHRQVGNMFVSDKFFPMTNSKLYSTSFRYRTEKMNHLGREIDNSRDKDLFKKTSIAKKFYRFVK